MEIVDACSGIWGAGRIGVHLSPYGTAHDIGDSHPEALFGYVVRGLASGASLSCSFGRRPAGKR